MLDYFRDELEGIDPQFGVSGKIVGGWDIHNKQYLLSTQTGGSEAYTKPIILYRLMKRF
jgi:hypothetical protein